ncbi:MAG: hypothetical protein WC205_10840 [Opitutaceae bacterium]|jgi:hypothetical protein
MMTRALLFFLMLSAGVGFLRAQSAAVPKSEPPPVMLRFYYLSYAGADTLGPDPSVDFLYRNGRGNASFHLGANTLSAPIAYRGPLPIELFRERKTVRGIERESLGRLDIPATWKGAIFLVVPISGSDAPLPFRFVPIEYGGTGLKDNHVRVVNLCVSPLAARLADTKEMIPSRGQTDLGFSEGADALFIRLALQHGERWRTVMSSMIPAPRRQRLLMIVVPGSPAGSDGSARIITVDDLPE